MTTGVCGSYLANGVNDYCDDCRRPRWAHSDRALGVVNQNRVEVRFDAVDVEKIARQLIGSGGGGGSGPTTGGGSGGAAGGGGSGGAAGGGGDPRFYVGHDGSIRRMSDGQMIHPNQVVRHGMDGTAVVRDFDGTEHVARP